MTRINITLTGERAEEYLRKQDSLEEILGYEPSHPETVGFMMNFDVSGEKPLIEETV